MIFAHDPIDPSVTEALDGLRLQLDAGVPMGRAMRSAGDICKTPGARALFAEALETVESGGDFDAALERLAPVLSYPERAVLGAGWRMGRVGESFKTVIERRRRLFATRRLIRSRLILPGMTLLAACFIIPLPRLILGRIGSGAYLAEALTPIVLVVIGYLVIRNMQLAATRAWAGWTSQDAPPPPSVFDRFMLAAPVLRGIQRQKNLAEFGQVMGHLLEAGLGFREALGTMARAMPNGVWRQAVARCAQGVLAGEPLSDQMRADRIWPREWVEAVAIGEESGDLPRTLRRMGDDARERYLDLVAFWGQWSARAAYFGVMIFTILGILKLAGEAGMM